MLNTINPCPFWRAMAIWRLRQHYGMERPNGKLTWNSKQHEYKGNVLFSDGHVEEWSDGLNSLSSRADLYCRRWGSYREYTNDSQWFRPIRFGQPDQFSRPVWCGRPKQCYECDPAGQRKRSNQPAAKTVFRCKWTRRPAGHIRLRQRRFIHPNSRRGS